MFSQNDLQTYAIDLDATPERIWEALTTSARMQQFGYRVCVDYDLRPGGSFRWFANDDMEAYGAPDVVVDGEVLECDPPKRLVLRWKMHIDVGIDGEPYTTVTFLIGDGSLEITHDLTGAPLQAMLAAGAVHGAGGGWPFVLRDLKRLLESA